MVNSDDERNRTTAAGNTSGGASSVQTGASESIVREIYRVGVKPPIFFKEEPDLYFIQMEPQFRNARITSEDTKYDHVIANQNIYS